jgi:hypothetical protein
MRETSMRGLWQPLIKRSKIKSRPSIGGTRQSDQELGPERNFDEGTPMTFDLEMEMK